MSNSRATYEESCRVLRDHGLLDSELPPPAPDHLPQYDDPEPLGVNFFRMFLGDGVVLANLTLPRTFFGRSEVNAVSFRNTDLSESNLCWNDFIEVDFSDACLAKSDARASRFVAVSFACADLQHADFRHSSFENCDFKSVNLDGAILTHDQGKGLGISAAQRRLIDWRSEPGSEPEGG